MIKLITLVLALGLVAAPALSQTKICPTDFAGRQTSDICWKQDRDGLFRQWSDTRQRFLPGPTMKLVGGSMEECDFQGKNCRRAKSVATK